MIIALTIQNEVKKPWYKRIFFKDKNSIEVFLKAYQNIELLHIKARKKRGEVPWEKISNLIKPNTQILYNNEIDIPEKYGFYKFKSLRFKLRLLKNSCVYIFKKLNLNPRSLKICVYDPKARYKDIVQSLVSFSSQINVITEKPELYTYEIDDIMEDFGAAILVSNSIDWLSPCHVLIAPDKIIKPLPINPNTVVFTMQRPSVAVKGIVYHDYKVDLPSKYTAIMPSELDYTYFLSAIYDENQVCELDKIFPSFLFSDFGTTELDKVANYIGGITSHS